MKDLPHITLEQYCTSHSSTPDRVLQQLERETHLTTIAPQMLPGALQGKLLEILSKLVRPRRILEVGAFTGYSTICLARGLADDGHMHTIEADLEREAVIRKYLSAAGLADKVQLHIGDALQWLRKDGQTYDLIYIDAGKRDYQAYHELTVPCLNTGGLLLFDNMLWGGKVITQPEDSEAQLLHALNASIRDDPRTECVVLPVRDGITLIRKK